MSSAINSPQTSSLKSIHSRASMLFCPYFTCVSMIILFLLTISVLAVSVTSVSHAPSDYCSKPADAELISNMFTHCNPTRDKTNCPLELWLQLFKDSDMKRGPKPGYKIVNIGFNKGYNFATWLNVFAPGANVDVTHWYNALKKIPSLSEDDLCGACGDCKSEPFKPTVPVTVGQIDPALHIVGVDLNNASVNIVNTVLAEIRRSHNISEAQLTTQLIYGAAGSPSDLAGSGVGPNKLKIPKCATGNELCKIPDDVSKLESGVEFDYVDVIGVDNLVKELHFLEDYAVKESSSKLNLNHADLETGNSLLHQAKMHRKVSKGHATDKIDLLHIDTEGNDAEVLKSTVGLLKHHKIRALIFEYHQFLPWGHTKLSGVVKELATYNMECYFLGQNRLWPISGACWHEQYEFHQWSNVMCILRTDPWLLAVRPIVQTVASLRAPFKEGAILKAFRFPEVYKLKDNKVHAFKTWEAFTRSHNASDLKETQYCNVHRLFPEGKQIE